MRSRLKCDECNFKTTSNTTLIMHKNSNHIKEKVSQIKIKTKMSNRTKCDICDKKFNKDCTYKKHMQKYHETVITNVDNVVKTTKTRHVHTHMKIQQEGQ